MPQDEQNGAASSQEFCSLPSIPERPLPSGLGMMRESFIRRIEKTWVNGTHITYCFFDTAKGHDSPSWWNGTDADKQVVRTAFQTWKNLGIGLEFIEVEQPNDALVRIGFMRGDGSWSYLGTDVREIPMNQRTMNFGWSLSSNWYGEETALHEIGHTLGAPHEHQNPNAGIDWNVDEVYRYFQGPPNNWDRRSIEHNILRTIPQREVDGSNWDPDSIMHYSFEAPLIDGPPPYNSTGISPRRGLSDSDKEWIRKFYPPLDDDKYVELLPFRSHWASLEPGDQLDFLFKPTYSRRYTLQTFGTVDTLLVLFEKDGANEIYLAGDDDSGSAYNAKITHRLIKGREYILRLRFYYSSQSGDTAVMVW